MQQRHRPVRPTQHGAGLRTTAPASSGSLTVTPTSSTTVDSASGIVIPPNGRLLLRGEATEPQEPARRIRWAEDVVNNEGMGKKSSKVCCIYHRPRAVGESSSEDESSSSDESDSDVDDGSARPARKRPDRGEEDHGDEHCDHERAPHGHQHRERKSDQNKHKKKASSNAYEKQPKVASARAEEKNKT